MATRRGAKDGDDPRDLFARAMGGVEPLAGDRVERPPVRPRHPGTATRVPPPARRAQGGRFEIDQVGELHRGRASGVDARRLGRLAAGEIAAELRVDLHGLSRDEACAALADALRRARLAGQRCVLVVHGRGLHSAGGPVLKRELPAWLAEPPHGREVLAFASAPPAYGGPGATLVLLRKSRR